MAAGRMPNNLKIKLNNGKTDHHIIPKTQEKPSRAKTIKNRNESGKDAPETIASSGGNDDLNARIFSITS